MMGPIGLPEMIIVLIMLAIPVVIVAAIVWFLVVRKRQILPPPNYTSIQERLTELDALKSKNLISELEYEEKRKQILSRL